MAPISLRLADGSTLEVNRNIINRSTTFQHLSNSRLIDIGYPNVEEIRFFFELLPDIDRGNPPNTTFTLNDIIILLNIAEFFGFTDVIDKITEWISQYLENEDFRVILSENIEDNISLFESLSTELQISIFQHLKINLRWIYKKYNLESDTTVSKDIKLLSGNLSGDTLAYGTRCKVVEYINVNNRNVNDKNNINIEVKKWIFKSNPNFTVLSNNNIVIIYPDKINYDLIIPEAEGYVIRVLGLEGDKYIADTKRPRFVKGGLGIIFNRTNDTLITDLNYQVFFQGLGSKYEIATDFSFIIDYNDNNNVNIIPWKDDVGFDFNNEIKLYIESYLPSDVNKSNYRVKIHISPESNLIGVEIKINRTTNYLLLYQVDGSIHTVLPLNDKRVLNIGIRGTFIYHMKSLNNKIISYINYSNNEIDVIHEGNIDINLIYTSLNDRISLIDKQLIIYDRLNVEQTNTIREYMNELLSK